MKKKVLFVTMVGTRFYAYYFVLGQMVIFNNGCQLEVDDMRGVEALAKADNFTGIVFHQTPEGKWEVK